MIAHPLDIHVGKRIARLYDDKILTREGLAKALNHPIQRINDYEAGRIRIGPAQLYEISRFFNVAVGYFFAEFLPDSSLK